MFLHRMMPSLVLFQVILLKLIDILFFFSSRRRHPRLQGAGVQTCALPISPPQPPSAGPPETEIAVGSFLRRPTCRSSFHLRRSLRENRLDTIRRPEEHHPDPAHPRARSEERRVGKEGRSRWAPYH